MLPGGYHWTGSLLCLAAAAGSASFAADQATVIYDDTASAVTAAPEKSKDLWIKPSDLKRATKFELKPQGVCTEAMCIPLPAGRKEAFIKTVTGETWFNLTEFARLLQQPVAHDAKHAIWYFGPRPEAQNSHVQTLTAPNFALPDLDGKMHSLTDFRGKKVLLITWGSW